MLGIVLAVGLPFLIWNLRQHSTARKFRRQFIELAGKEGVQMTKHDIWHKSYAIALDSKIKKLLYLKREKSDIIPRIINLDHVEGCRIAMTDILDEKKDGSNPESYKLDLILHYNNGSNSELALEFYNNAAFMPSPDDHSHIAKWHRIISEHIN